LATKLYVCNLPFRMTDRDLAKLFAPFGNVESAQLAVDKETGRPKGFGFVEMASPEEADAARAGLDGKQIGGRALMVQEYKARDPNAPRMAPAPRQARTPKAPRKRPPALGSKLRRPRGDKPK
jgi:cold-inducible RNA-binding protein